VEGSKNNKIANNDPMSSEEVMTACPPDITSVDLKLFSIQNPPLPISMHFVSTKYIINRNGPRATGDERVN
jgi:hypothetical protein